MSVDHCIKAYKGEVWLPGCQYTSYSEFERAKEECSNNIDKIDIFVINLFKNK